MKQAATRALPALGLFAGLLISSCSSDDSIGNTPEPNPEPDPEPTTEEFVLSLAIQGSEGNFTYYTVPFEDVMSGSLSAEGQGIEQPGYFDFKQIDNTIYSIGGLDDVNVVAITQSEDGELVQTGDVSFPNSLSDIVKADDNKLVAVSLSANSDQVAFYTLDETSVAVTSTVNRPISDLTEGVTDASVPAFSGMQIVGDNLFLSYYLSDPNTFDTNYTDFARVAVYSYPGFEFQKVITSAKVGPIGGFNIASGLIEDENGNIYAVSHTNPANGFSQITNNSGIILIENGDTDFELNYLFDVYEEAGGTPVHLKYLGDGKAFAEINMTARGNQARWSDSPLRSAIIDLETRTVNFIDGIPQHNGAGRRLAAAQSGEFVYMAIPEGDGISVYQINTTDYTAAKGAEVEANFVAGFFKL